MTRGTSRGRLRAGAVLLALAALAVGCDDETGDAPLPERITASSASTAPPAAPAPPQGAPEPPGGGAPEAPGKSDAPGARPAGCPASGVRVEAGTTEAAMGLRALGLVLHNCGAQPFRVSGYPEVAVLGERGEALEVTVREGSNVDSTARPSTFLLAPGQRARASAVWRNTVTRTDVVATNGTHLRVTPGAGAAAQTVAPADGGPLDLGNTGTLEVTPWKPYDTP
ncbi:DUF4232 domain-containing protein [Streptomyces lavendulocolor]|uniref:DUF4232 domain-containing protein n=1 Tax=Streptomyces lavendulocolor TaxID=67316 RepID=A0ABV2VX99_9ACTN